MLLVVVASLVEAVVRTMLEVVVHVVLVLLVVADLVVVVLVVAGLGVEDRVLIVVARIIVGGVALGAARSCT